MFASQEVLMKNSTNFLGYLIFHKIFRSFKNILSMAKKKLHLIVFKITNQMSY
jgi:hypothetical protein